MQTSERAAALIDNAAVEAGVVPAAEQRRSAARFVLMLVPVLIVAWMAWQHRWTADDGFINFRIVRNIREGHGPVHNAGDRVESGTSSLWDALLALADLVTPFRLEWIALVGGLGSTLGGLTFAILGTRRVLLRLDAPAGVLLPLGALVYVALVCGDFAAHLVLGSSSEVPGCRLRRREFGDGYR